MLKIVARLILGLFAVVVLVVLGLAVAFLFVNKTNGKIESSGEVRRYLLYVPKTYDPAVPTPLVISIHGLAEWPAHQRDISHWNEVADENGFIVVYPAGTGIPLHWRAGGRFSTGAELPMDVAFISRLIDKLEAEYNIDPRRIYANGLSNGGGMSFLLACKLSDRIAAIGGVSGAYMLPWDECTPGRPVPMIAFHGTSDPIVSYQGSQSSSHDSSLPAIPDWIKTLANHNGCNEVPVELPAVGEVSGIQYTPCSQNADVVFYTVQGGGHSWPGGEPLPKFIVGHTTQDVDATRLMWDFFTRHPMPEN
jgi:polyhydroxybutyrate depolymerase